MKILVLNCGSSSLKYQLIDMTTQAVMCSGLAERIGDNMGQITHKAYPGMDNQKVISVEKPFKDHTAALGSCAELITGGEAPVAKPSEIGAIGHRVVHGGEAFRQPTIITPEVVETIKQFCALAPLHNPAGLMGIEAATALYPGVSQVAIFDTAFHGTIPDYAFLFAIPYELYEELGIRRYGFHGTSHGYVAKKLAQVVGKPFEKTSCITVHLGNGCSMAAVKNGQCVDTSMGLTPLMGLMMGTRSGDVDPSLHAFLSTNKGLSIDQVDTLLNKKSGLKGICGLNDMRDIHAAREKGDKKAELALKMFCYRVKHYIGAYLAALDGCDAVVFTAGIGENDADVRQGCCDTLGAVGVKIDRDRNYGFKRGQITKISTDDSPVAIYIIPTNEELEIATQTNSLVNGK
ncbi:MAG: acetate kinase [Desulfovibrio sp.]|nr:acetate kinase [Desulfovibrio sp.]MBI4961569.1 acetate kinase [Desulfovibrio sp.]